MIIEIHYQKEQHTYTIYYFDETGNNKKLHTSWFKAFKMKKTNMDYFFYDKENNMIGRIHHSGVFSSGISEIIEKEV